MDTQFSTTSYGAVALIQGRHLHVYWCERPVANYIPLRELARQVYGLDIALDTDNHAEELIEATPGVMELVNTPSRAKASAKIMANIVERGVLMDHALSVFIRDLVQRGALSMGLYKVYT